MVTCIQDPLFSERTSDFGFRTLDRRGVQRRWLTLVDDLNGMVSWSQWYVTPISCEATQAKRWLSVQPSSYVSPGRPRIDPCYLNLQSLRSVVASTSVASGFWKVGTTQPRAAQSEWLPRLQVRALVKMAARCF